MMKTLCLAVFLCGALIASAAASRMPNFRCTFSTRLIEDADYNDTASVKDRIMATLMFSRNPQRRLAAQEALLKLKNGESVTGFRNKIHDEAFWYMIEDECETIIMERNNSMYWKASSGSLTQVVPFFDRFTCATFVEPDIPISCVQPIFTDCMSIIDVKPCPNHPGEQCDVWEGTSQGYTQTVYMVHDTNTLDVLEYKSDNYFYHGAYVGMDTSKPDPSHFVPPSQYPCSDYTKKPSSASTNTWSTKKYPGKKFQLNPLSQTLFRASQPQMPHFDAPQTPRLAVPESFDARKYWPKCPTIKEIRDQGTCGSCWAHGAAESFGDRYCITTGDSITFSPQYLVDCYADNDGCNGGYPDLTWFDLIKTGIVSDECKPYYAEDEQCTETCDDHSSMKKYYAKSAYSPYAAFDFNKTVQLIQEEIMTNGPVEAAFYVFSDFMSYSSGVYQRRSVDLDGGHAVKIIGWGVDESTKLPYWLITNSWGDDWGEKGFFRIRRGTNECDIETEIATGLIKN